MVIIMKKCIIASILALMLSLTTFAQATALPEPQKSQAKGQLTKAKEELATKKEKLSLMSEGQRDSDF